MRKRRVTKTIILSTLGILLGIGSLLFVTDAFLYQVHDITYSEVITDWINDGNETVFIGGAGTVIMGLVALCFHWFYGKKRK